MRRNDNLFPIRRLDLVRIDPVHPFNITIGLVTVTDPFDYTAIVHQPDMIINDLRAGPYEIRQFFLVDTGFFTDDIYQRFLEPAELDLCKLRSFDLGDLHFIRVEPFIQPVIGGFYIVFLLQDLQMVSKRAVPEIEFLFNRIVMVARVGFDITIDLTANEVV